MKTITAAINKTQLLRLENVVYTSAFIIPIALHQQQLIVGSTVNILLFISARKLSKKHLVPLAILPSIAALLNGALFGPFTPFLIYIAPFIWAGNLIQMMIFKYATKIPSLLRIICASGAKAGLLFIVAFTFVHFSIIPNIFLTAMGMVQLITALIGGAIALLVLRRLNSNN